MKVKATNETIEPLLLRSTPAVMSVGFRCVEKGYKFTWPPYSMRPYYTLPNKKRVYMYSEGYCPYLNADGSSNHDTALPSEEIVTVPNTKSKRNAVPKHDSSTDDKYANEISIKERAVSLKHILTHYPKNPCCETCQIAKLQSAPCPDDQNVLPTKVVRTI